MSYQRFKFPETASRAATVATVATLRTYPGQTVASVAGVAGGKNETAILGAPACLPEPDLVELEERKGMAMDSVPERYLAAWARMQCQKPMRVSDADWRQAIDDAGRFLDQWGSRGVEFNWMAGDLFDVPHGDKVGGLIWFLTGEAARSFGPRACGDNKRSCVRLRHALGLAKPISAGGGK